ncbi:MAG: hypothetical protein COB14_04145 [Alphaproteobacteria bacterium]|nr:MAG: hypothetical protein COB14_04145 [Alphaproteobacteria bacterium]
MYDNLHDLIDRIHSSKDENEAFVVLIEAFGDYGYDRVMFVLSTDHPSLNLPTAYGMMGTYPESWLKHYIEKQFFTQDIVSKKALMPNSQPFYWGEINDLQGVQKEIMDLRLEGDFINGMCVPLQRNGEYSGVGISRSTGMNFIEEDYDERDYLFLNYATILVNAFSEKFRKIHGQNESIKLNTREYDILCYRYEGLNDVQISSVLGLHRQTIRYHWGNIFLKLNVSTQTQAVLKAVMSGYIQLKLHNNHKNTGNHP